MKENAAFAPLLYVKTIISPRQARDKHCRETSKKERRFLIAWGVTTKGREGTYDIVYYSDDGGKTYTVSKPTFPANLSGIFEEPTVRAKTRLVLSRLVSSCLVLYCLVLSCLA